MGHCVFSEPVWVCNWKGGSVDVQSALLKCVYDIVFVLASLSWQLKEWQCWSWVRFIKMCVEHCVFLEQVCVDNWKSGNVWVEFGLLKCVWGIVFWVSKFVLTIHRVAMFKFNSVYENVCGALCFIEQVYVDHLRNGRVEVQFALWKYVWNKCRNIKRKEKTWT